MAFACLKFLLSSTLLILVISSPVPAAQSTQVFRVSATIVAGCSIGGGTTDNTKFGTLDFGNISSLAKNIDVISGQNAGSIVIQCVGVNNVNVAIDPGMYMAAATRRMKNSTTGEFLSYQIFKDSARSQIWGDGTNGGSLNQINVASGGLILTHLYARLFANSEQPSPGIYTDTLSVTLTY